MKKIKSKCVYCPFKYSCIYPFTGISKECVEADKKPLFHWVRPIWLQNLGQLAQAMRTKNKIRVSEMAELTGYSVGTIARFEHGENNNLLLYLMYVEICEKAGVENVENTENTTIVEPSDNGC